MFVRSLGPLAAEGGLPESSSERGRLLWWRIPVFSYSLRNLSKLRALWPAIRLKGSDDRESAFSVDHVFCDPLFCRYCCDARGQRY